MICSHPNRARSDLYDAEYCMDCRAWLEPACDEECGYCLSRPETAIGDV